MKLKKNRKREELLSSLHDGDVVEGKVARLTDFGAFIDLGGVDGLVHVSEIAHQHVGKPSDALTVGEDVQVKFFQLIQKKDVFLYLLKKHCLDHGQISKQKQPLGLF